MSLNDPLQTSELSFPKAGSQPQRSALLRSWNLWIGVTVSFFFFNL
jgi:hypothetical protein